MVLGLKGGGNSVLWNGGGLGGWNVLVSVGGSTYFFLVLGSSIKTKKKLKGTSCSGERKRSTRMALKYWRWVFAFRPPVLTGGGIVINN